MNPIPESLNTERLTMRPLSAADNLFIMQLVNTKGWLQFIGNRNVNSINDAADYIQKILSSSNVLYWIVSLKQNNQPIGTVTLIKRSYLDHHDIGFAFLPEFSRKGYAYEASFELLKNVIRHREYESILATTIPGNVNSIKLLEKLGLHFDREIDADGEKLHVYKITAGEFRVKQNPAS